MSGSTIPAVLTALSDVWKAAVPELQHGEGTITTSEDDFVIVAYDDDEELAAVSGTRATADYAYRSDSEAYDVLCLLSAWNGDADTRGIRSTLFGYLDRLDTALDAMKDLDAVNVAAARVTEFAFAQPITEVGSTATLRFTVHIEAWRN